jgi:hypothetical protein
MNTITVDAVIEWAESQRIPLGKNPRRTLTYLASQGIIPKSVKGPECKGVYHETVIKQNLLFYRDRRSDGWKSREIRRAMQRLHQAPAGDMPDMPTIPHALAGAPIGDLFRRVFDEFTESNPDAARDIIRYFDEQSIQTGSRIGTAFRQLIGADRRLKDLTQQSPLDIWAERTPAFAEDIL